MKELLILQLIMLVLQRFEYINLGAFWLFLPVCWANIYSANWFILLNVAMWINSTNSEVYNEL